MYVLSDAMMLSMGVQIALGLIYFGSSAAFNAFSGVGVICLTTSYAMPIAVSLLNKREAIKDASFHLGKLGVICNYVSLGAFPPFCDSHESQSLSHTWSPPPLSLFSPIGALGRLGYPTRGDVVIVSFYANASQQNKKLGLCWPFRSSVCPLPYQWWPRP